MTEIISETLRGQPHFRLVDREIIDGIAKSSRLRRFTAGESVFRARDPARGFFVIREGAVRLFRLSADGREHIVNQVRAPQSFAEAALLNHGFYPVNATATVETELIEVAGERFLQLFREDSHLAAAIVGSLSMRMLELVERVDELSAMSAGARLARHVLRLPAKGALEAPEVTLTMAKKDLAAQLSITPETLSRTLRSWRERGLIESEGRRLILRDVRILEALADGAEG